MHVTVASVLSYLVIRPRLFYKINKNKRKRKINIDLAVVASQMPGGAIHDRIETKLSTAFHPRTDGQTEQVNQELEQYLRMFVDYCQEQWPDWLGTAEFTYNNKVNSSTKVSPFMANNGRNPRMDFEIRKKGKVLRAEEFAAKMKEIQEEAQAALRKAQEEMKKQADRHRREVEKYKVRDMVVIN